MEVAEDHLFLSFTWLKLGKIMNGVGTIDIPEWQLHMMSIVGVGQQGSGIFWVGKTEIWLGVPERAPA